MTELIYHILDLMDITLIQIVSTLAVKLCLFAVEIRIAKHFFELLCEALRSRRNGRHITDPKPRIQAKKGPVTYFAPNRYGVNDNCYRFEYIKQNGSWRAYIIRMPDLQGRDAGGAITHRMYDGGRAYICWNREVMKFKDIRAISHVWADKIQKYIATGERFG